MNLRCTSFCAPLLITSNGTYVSYVKGVTVYDVMNLFNVEFDFALRRLEMYKSKILSEI